MKQPTIKCDDGHYVRSRAEAIIDNWFYNHGILHSYEIPVFLKDNPDEIMLCDFYIPEADIYIEYWGLDEYQYEARREVKTKLYNKNNLNLFELEERNTDYIPHCLIRAFGKYIRKR